MEGIHGRRASRTTEPTVPDTDIRWHGANGVALAVISIAVVEVAEPDAVDPDAVSDVADRDRDADADEDQEESVAVTVAECDDDVLLAVTNRRHGFAGRLAAPLACTARLTRADRCGS